MYNNTNDQCRIRTYKSLYIIVLKFEQTSETAKIVLQGLELMWNVSQFNVSRFESEDCGQNLSRFKMIRHN